MATMQASGFRKHLGIEIIHADKERTEGAMPVTAEHCRPGDVMHGGAFMAFGDAVGGVATVAMLPQGVNTVTIESKTNFFAAIPKGDTAKAVTTPLHVGRTTIVVQTRITRGDGKLAAIVTQTQLVLQPKA